MKIKFIPLLFVLGLIGVKAQITVAPGAKLFISPNTSVYSTGDLTVTDDPAKTTRVTNNGNILIQDGTYKGGATSGLFVMSYTDDSDYGQMIVNSGNVASGIMDVERLITDAGNNIYFGAPFTGYSFAQFGKDVTNNGSFVTPTSPCGSGVQCPNWSKVPIFKWNDPKTRFDPDNTGTFKEGGFYMIRKAPFTGADFTSKLTVKGTPAVASKVVTPLPFSNRVQSGAYKIGENGWNIYKIRYYAYVTDPFAVSVPVFDSKTTNAVLDAAYYGDRSIQMVNPYTANIDLTKLVDLNDIEGIGTFTGITTNAEVKTRYAGTLQKATVSGGAIVAGDHVRYIPPMTNFFLKANKDGVSISKLNDPSILTFTSNYDRATNNVTVAKISAKSAKSISTVNQVALRLNSVNKDIFYGHTYVASGTIFQTGVTNNNFEATNLEIPTGGTGIYTIPEAETGGAATGSEDVKLYINTLNSESAKVAIPVGVSIDPEDGSTFTITSALSENMEPLANELTNFSDTSAKFYFHDKELNVVKEITTNFSYTFTQKESTNDRFEIFWKETGSLGTDEENIQSLTGLTTVYKSGEEHKVRFNKNWKEAEVTVFNIMGQLISSQKKINTQNDYVLPIGKSSSTMYIIKITNEKGESVTKKIVK